jgi:Tol biopolymer transport system component
MPAAVAAVLAVAAGGLAAAPAAAQAAAPSSPWQGFTLSRVNLAADGSQAVGGQSFFPSISADGRIVAYRTNAQNAGGPQTFTRDRVTGKLTPVILRPDGGPSFGSQIIRTSISGDGRYVGFCSMAGDLVPGTVPFSAIRGFVRDAKTGTTALVTVDENNKEFPSDADPVILSGDGRSAAFGAGGQVYVRRLDTKKTVKVSLPPEDENWGWGSSAGDFPSLSYDGRLVAFTRTTGTERFVYVRDLLADKTTRIALGGPGTWTPASEPNLSPDGRYVILTSARNLTGGPDHGSAQVYRHDLKTGKNLLVSVGLGGAPVDAESSDPGISAGGRFVVFASGAANLVPNDTNDGRDVFVRDVEAGVTVRINVGPGGAQANALTSWVQPLISADGRSVVFSSRASNLVYGDTNYVQDVFVADAQ